MDESRARPFNQPDVPQQTRARPVISTFSRADEARARSAGKVLRNRNDRDLLVGDMNLHLLPHREARLLQPIAAQAQERNLASVVLLLEYVNLEDGKVPRNWRVS